MRSYNCYLRTLNQSDRNFAPCKIIQIPESRQFLLAKSTQESTEWNPEFKTILDFL